MNVKQTRKEFSLMIMTAFFVMSFLLLVSFGTRIYRSIAVSGEETSLSRTLSSYLHTASKMNEAGIFIQEKEGKTILCIREETTDYGNRIYLHEGYLVEDFGRLDGDLYADSAMKIAPCTVFEIERVNDALMKIVTDDGEVFIALFEGGNE